MIFCVLKQLAKEVPEQLRALFNLAIYAGLRKGELLALEWSDVDFENDTVTVSKAVSVVAGKWLFPLLIPSLCLCP